MMTAGIEVKMTPSHPGDFVRTEVIDSFPQRAAGQVAACNMLAGVGTRCQ